MSVTYKQETIKELNIIPTYKDLMEASLGESSAYLRAKETITALMEDTNISEKDKASLVSQTIANIASNVTNTAMEMAYKIEISKLELPYSLTKMREDTLATQYNNVLLDKESTIKTNQAAQILAQTDAIKVGNAVNYAKTYDATGIKLLSDNDSQVTYFGTTLDLTEANKTGNVAITKTKADTYSTYANSYRINGHIAVEEDANGAITPTTLTVNNTDLDLTDLSHGLNYHQTRVSARNVTAFDDNKIQHAVNASSSFLAMAASSPNIEGYTQILCRWQDAMEELKPTDGVCADG